jgi:hypothetical protein
MSLQYIFPDHTARNRHIAIAVEISAAVIALVLMIWAGVHYWSVPEKEVVKTPVDFIAQKRAALEQPNPMVVLSATEISQRRASQEQGNPPAKLTTEQIEARKSSMENI